MSKNLIDKTYYEILNIVPSASLADIERAYKKAREVYSPNSPALYSVFTPHEAKELARLIEDAYTVLINPHSREQYDFRISPKKEVVSRKKAEPITPLAQYMHFETDENFENQISSTTDFDGAFLKKIREYKNVTIPTLSEKSRISKTYIKAIEDENFDKLPATVFVRGFIDQYAKLLKLDHGKITLSYVNKVKLHRGE